MLIHILLFIRSILTVSICNLKSLKSELMEDLADNGQLDCLRRIPIPKTPETQIQRDNRLKAQWSSDCAFEGPNNWYKHFKTPQNKSFEIYDQEGQMQQSDSNEQADLCEFVRSAIYQQLIGDYDSSKDNKLSKIQQINAIQQITCAGLSKGTVPCAVNAGSYFNSDSWVILMQGQIISIGKSRPELIENSFENYTLKSKSNKELQPDIYEENNFQLLDDTFETYQSYPNKQEFDNLTDQQIDENQQPELQIQDDYQIEQASLSLILTDELGNYNLIDNQIQIKNSDWSKNELRQQEQVLIISSIKNKGPEKGLCKEKLFVETTDSKDIINKQSEVLAITDTKIDKSYLNYINIQDMSLRQNSQFEDIFNFEFDCDQKDFQLQLKPKDNNDFSEISFFAIAFEKSLDIKNFQFKQDLKYLQKNEKWEDFGDAKFTFNPQQKLKNDIDELKYLITYRSNIQYNKQIQFRIINKKDSKIYALSLTNPQKQGMIFSTDIAFMNKDLLPTFTLQYKIEEENSTQNENNIVIELTRIQLPYISFAKEYNFQFTVEFIRQNQWETLKQTDYDEYQQQIYPSSIENNNFPSEFRFKQIGNDKQQIVFQKKNNQQRFKEMAISNLKSNLKTKQQMVIPIQISETFQKNFQKILIEKTNIIVLYSLQFSCNKADDQKNKPLNPIAFRVGYKQGNDEYKLVKNSISYSQNKGQNFIVNGIGYLTTDLDKNERYLAIQYQVLPGENQICQSVQIQADLKYSVMARRINQ